MTEEVHMEFLVTRAELQTLCSFGRTISFALQNKKYLTPPITGIGAEKLFCLRTALYEVAKLRDLALPTDAVVFDYWQSALYLRHLAACTKK
jgi:hypothetical protein